jgi:hypothetical protein
MEPVHRDGDITCRAYRELDPPARPHTHEIGSAILHVQVIVDPDFDDRFLGWYINEHVPAVLDAPGMIAARRFEQVHLGSNTDADGGPRIYRTVYEMTEASVIRQPETLEASLRGACPAELAPHRQASNQVYAEVFGKLEPCEALVHEPDSGAKVIVPPRMSATRSKRSNARDRTVRRVRKVGRRRWKKESGYHQQARVENTFF